MKILNILAASCLGRAYAAFDFNKGGASLKAPSNESFTSVTGTFTVPSLTGSNRLSIWLGIADSSSQNYVLAGGVVFNKTLGTFASFFPGAPTDTTSAVPVAANDTITVVASLTSASGGTVVIENKTQNKTTTQTVLAPATVDSSALSALYADWWVQGYQVIPGELLTTPDFGTVTFSNVGATLVSGKAVDATGAGRYELQGTSGQIFTQTTISGKTIVVKQQKICGTPNC